MTTTTTDLRELRNAQEVVENEAATGALMLREGLAKLADVDADELIRLGVFTNDADASRFGIGLELFVQDLRRVEAARAARVAAVEGLGR